MKRQNHAFAVGAWVRDPLHDRLTSGGIVQDGRGGYKLEPSAGEVVALLTHKRMGDAYKIQFGDFSNIVLASGCICRDCGSTSDDTHLEWCWSAPGAWLRETPHEAGFAP